MQEVECLGCRTSFQEGQKIIPSHPSIWELKTYTIPMKEHRQRWNFLKTIVSLINYKGGTILIGINEISGQVEGLHIDRKEQDDFRIFVQQLTSRIQPEVDLSDREQIIVHYVPVMKKQQASGKFVTKVIVQQGDPTQTYCFSQRIQLQMQYDKKSVEDYEFMYSFKKNNLGACIEYKGYQLIQQTRRKALNPSKIYNTFHQGCNPELFLITHSPDKIGFAQIQTVETRNKLQKWFKMYLEEQKVYEKQSQVKWDEELQMITVSITNKSKFQEIINFIEKNISQLNEYLPDCKFVKAKQNFANIHIFHNNFNYKKDKGKNMDFMDKKIVKKGQQTIKAGKGKKFKKNLCLTFTHINTNKRQELCNKIQALLQCPKEIKTFVNSIQVLFNDRKQYLSYASLVQMEIDEFMKYGFNGEINFGKNTGVIEITNYNNELFRQMKGYIQGIVGKDLKSCTFSKIKKKFKFVLEFRSAEIACGWLDVLLMDKNLKQFEIPGTDKGYKMKYYLICSPLDAHDLEG